MSNNNNTAESQKEELIDIQALKQALRNNRLAVHNAIGPSFVKVLISIPLLEEHHFSLRTRFKSDPDNTIEDLLDLVVASKDISLWKEFMKALDANNLSRIRWLLVSDETIEIRSKR